MSLDMNPELSQDTPADKIDTGASDRISTVWKQAVSEYLDIVELSERDCQWISQIKASTDVVASAVQDSNTHEMFISAVQSAGTHNDLVSKVVVLRDGNVPAVVSNQVATFLRYASAVDSFLDAMGNTTFISAFVFGAVRFMLDIAVKNLRLLIAIRDKFADVDIRLRRLDNYLAIKEPTEAVQLMTIRVLLNTLRFYGLATKYFRRNAFWSSIRLKNQMEAVITDMEKDATVEIASGVSHINVAIERIKEDILTTKEAPLPPAHVMIMPYQRNPHFIGRDELLDELYVRLSETKPKQYNHRIAIYGMGGVGKTQAAIEFAYRNVKFYQGIYWISAADEAALLSGFQEIAIMTQCVTGARNLRPTQIAKRVLSWLREQAGWLIIYDNLENVSVVKDYLPDMTSGGHTLITTRNPNAISIPAEGLEIGVLDLHSASEMLCTRSDVALSDPMVQAEAAKIATELGCLPLAIEQAAAYIREASKDIFTFLQTYQEDRKELLQRVPDGNWDYSSSVARTWLLSISIIEKLNSDAMTLLQLFAFLNPDLILREFLQAGQEGVDGELRCLIQSQRAFEEAVYVLERFSLVRRSKEGIVMHRLVQAVIKENLNENQFHRQWESTISLCYAAFPRFTPESRVLCRRFQDQVTILLSAPSRANTITLGQILERVGSFLQHDGKFKEAEAFHSKSVNVLTAVLEKNDPMLLTAIHSLQKIYRLRGKLNEGVKLGEENLQAMTLALGEAHPETLDVLATLGWTYESQGRIVEAQKLQERCLRLRVEVLGEKHPDTLIIMSTLGWTYHVQGRLADAQKLQERALDLAIEVLGEKHASTLTSMSDLGWTYQIQGRIADSLKLQERCLQLRIEVLGEKHPDTLNTMGNLGWTYHRVRGRLADAQRLQERCMELKVEVLGEEHSDTLITMGNLALTYQSQGRLNDAQKLQESCLRVFMQELGTEHFRTLNAVTNLAVTYRLQRRLEEALKLEENCLKSKRRLLGEEHVDTMESIWNLAAIYSELGRFNEAMAIEGRNLEIKKRVLGESHHQTSDTERNLEEIYRKKHQSLTKANVNQLRGDNHVASEIANTVEIESEEDPENRTVLIWIIVLIFGISIFWEWL